MNQELHKWLSHNFCRMAVWKEHVHETVEWKQGSNFCDDKKFLSC
jgi:hypothetical protein